MFQLKDFKSILAGVVNLVRGVTGLLTDFNPGSATRTLLEAPAAEIEELYIQMYHGIIEAIPVAIYGAFDFGQLAATSAYGYVTFARATAASADITIPAGTVVTTTAGLSFATTDVATLLTGQYNVSVVAQCQTAGAAGNVTTGSITVLTTVIAGVETVTNMAAFTTGRDVESEQERKDRFRAYIATLTRGTKAAVEYGAKTATILTSGIVTEYVSAVRVIEYDDDFVIPIGTIRVIVYNGVNGASQELVDTVQVIVDGDHDNGVPGWKAAGIVATVSAAEMLTAAISETLTIQSGYDAASVTDDVKAAQIAYVASLSIGVPVIRSELIAAAMAVPGVYNCTMTVPVVDVATSIDQVAMVSAETIAVTVA